tara:strand:- start:7323 stop:7685 length:363 start_codon:yes stop_codon:yes gene_type:complete
MTTTTNMTPVEKLRVLDAFVDMYAARIQTVSDVYAPRHARVAVVVTMPEGATRIVPDMRIEYLEADALLARLDTDKPGVPGAMSMVMNARDGNVPFVVVYADRDALATMVRAHLRSEIED